MEMLDVQAVGDGGGAELVGFADANASFDPSAGEPT